MVGAWKAVGKVGQEPRERTGRLGSNRATPPLVADGMLVCLVIPAVRF